MHLPFFFLDDCPKEDCRKEKTSSGSFLPLGALLRRMQNSISRILSRTGHPAAYLTELTRAYTPWCETEDLKQESALALLDAAGRFDPAYGTKLLTYATPVMEAALSDYAARYSSSLPVPISRYNQLRRVE